MHPAEACWMGGGHPAVGHLRPGVAQQPRGGIGQELALRTNGSMPRATAFSPQTEQKRRPAPPPAAVPTPAPVPL